MVLALGGWERGSGRCGALLGQAGLPLPRRRHWMHSEMWWPRLFAAHSEISWDDYEKDYSDLPAEVLRRHRCAGRAMRQPEGGGVYLGAWACLCACRTQRRRRVWCVHNKSVPEVRKVHWK